MRQFTSIGEVLRRSNVLYVYVVAYTPYIIVTKNAIALTHHRVRVETNFNNCANGMSAGPLPLKTNHCLSC